MRVGLFEDACWEVLLPFTRTRPIWRIWWGMDTLAAKWNRYYGYEVLGYLPARSYLWQLYPPVSPPGPITWINARLLPHTPDLSRWLTTIEPDKLYCVKEGIPVALRTQKALTPSPTEEPTTPPWKEPFKTAEVPQELELYWLRHPTDLFQHTGNILAADWLHWKAPRSPLPPSLSVRGKDNLYLHPTARVGFACIDAEQGPVWIGPHAEIQDGCLLQHTNAIGPHTTLLLGAKIRTHNSIGPWCKIGGEVGQSTFLGYSNKAHEGFVGHSVIAEWCNIGAGSNTSNLKNTYGTVRLYNPSTQQVEDTGLQFCGLLMGDYARCGIQTPFTTGCMVDLFANVVSTTFTPKYIPPFTWSEGQKWSKDKMLIAAQRMKMRRGLHLSDAEAALLQELWEMLNSNPIPEQNA
ncbi:MAG: putative sugar nucleotidyl transferase [Bacteroidia bacterium]|nr:putative sugar nucleotidyl transferase [Bacteroidia bacterium]